LSIFQNETLASVIYEMHNIIMRASQCSQLCGELVDRRRRGRD